MHNRKLFILAAISADVILAPGVPINLQSTIRSSDLSEATDHHQEPGHDQLYERLYSHQSSHTWVSKEKVDQTENTFLSDQAKADHRYQRVWVDIEKQRLLCEEQCIENYKKLLDVKKESYKGLRSPSIEDHEVWQRSTSNADSQYHDDDFRNHKKHIPISKLFSRRRTTTVDLYP